MDTADALGWVAVSRPGELLRAGAIAPAGLHVVANALATLATDTATAYSRGGRPSK